MARIRERKGWLAALRRDRALFALMGAFAVLFGLLQPAAAARNAGFERLFVLCAPQGPSGRLPTQEPQCPLCATGHLCALASFPYAQAAQAAMPPLPAGAPAGPALHAPDPLSAGGGAVPPIRAPPRVA